MAVAPDQQAIVLKQAQDICKLAPCLNRWAASMGPSYDPWAIGLAVYNKMADIMGKPHAVAGSRGMSGVGHAMQWANQCNLNLVMSDADFIDYITRCFDQLTASITPSPGAVLTAEEQAALDADTGIAGIS